MQAPGALNRANTAMSFPEKKSHRNKAYVTNEDLLLKTFLAYRWGEEEARKWGKEINGRQRGTSGLGKDKEITGSQIKVVFFTSFLRQHLELSVFL